jgi:phenylalanyl-tRNA synthetase beta chain
MIVSLDWLKEYVDLPGDAAFIAERLTAIGIEVEHIVTLGGDFEGVVVGEIEALERHPNADQLWVARVHTGEGRRHQVVTGAANVAVGDRVPVAPVGARLADGTVMQARTLRGLESQGMICSAAELALGTDASGLMILDRQAPVGADLKSLYPPDTLLECEISPGRPDCQSHLGIARELAAATGRSLRLPETPANSKKARAAGAAVKVEISDPGLCRRYMARVIRNVQVAPSPPWLQRRLRAVGVRPINNVVDVTNFVTLEVGQPLHAFDLDRLHGPRIEVRPARAGERLKTLDEQDRALQASMLVIADASRPVALAGVIGGLDTAVRNETKNILLESATFEGANIRATSKALTLRTEASIRFEKQLSPALAEMGADRGARLVLEVCGGTVEEALDQYPRPFTPPAVKLDVRRLHRMLGPEVTLDESRQILERLGFTARVVDDCLEAHGPPFRLDVNIPEDLVEEIGRMRGWEKMHATLPGRRNPLRDLFVPQDLEERIRAVLVGAGLDEVLTYAFTSGTRAPAIGVPGRPKRVLEIVKPVTSDWDALRTSLLPGLLATAEGNHRVGLAELGIFEIGHAFWPVHDVGQQPDEPLLLACLETVPTPDPLPAKVALRRLKGVLERLRWELTRRPLTFEPAVVEGFHPGRCALLRDGQEVLGVLGEVHPDLVRAEGLAGRAVAAEVRVPEFSQAGRGLARAQPLPRFPAVERDLAVFVPNQTLSADLVQVMQKSGGYTLADVQIVDEYEGPQGGEGRKSLAFRLIFQAPDRTLTSEEVNAALGRIAGQLKAGGAEIRGTI